MWSGGSHGPWRRRHPRTVSVALLGWGLGGLAVYLLLAAIPRSWLIVYKETGHVVLWEQPERVATDLADFVAGLSTSGQNSTPIS